MTPIRYDELRERVHHGARHLADALFRDARRRHDRGGELIALLAMPATVDRWTEVCRLMASRERPLSVDEVVTRLDAWWPDDVRTLPIGWGTRLSNGTLSRDVLRLVRLVRVTADSWWVGFLNDGDELGHIASIELIGTAALDLAALSHCTGLGGLRSVRIVAPGSRFVLRAAWFEVPHLKNLHRLALENLELVAEDIDVLCRSDVLGRLDALVLRDASLDPELAAPLLDTPALGHLRELDLSLNSLGPGVVDVLGDARHLCNLETLRLQGCALASCASDLFEQPHLCSVRTIDLSTNFAGRTLLEPLAEPDAMPALEHLYVAWNKLGDAGLVPLCEPGAAKRPLHTLALAGNELTETGLRALIASTQWTRLRELDLGSNAIDDEAAGLLPQWFGVRRLEHLGLAENPISARGLDWLITRAHDADDVPFALSSLDVGGTRVNDRFVAELAASQRVPHLHELRAPGSVIRMAQTRVPELASHARLRMSESTDTPPPVGRLRQRHPSPRSSTSTSPDRTDAIDTLLQLADAEPSTNRWSAFCEQIDALNPDMQVTAELARRMRHWPDDMRVLPERWLDTDAPPGSALARTFVVRGERDVARVGTLTTWRLASGTLRVLRFVGLDDVDLHNALSSWPLSDIRRVGLVDCQLETRWLGRSLTERFPALESLSMSRCELEPACVEGLHDPDGLHDRLLELALDACELTLAHLEGLCAGIWRDLARLSLQDNALTDDLFDLLGRQASVDSVAELDLRGNPALTEASIVASLRRGILRELDTLKLDPHLHTDRVLDAATERAVTID